LLAALCLTSKINATFACVSQKSVVNIYFTPIGYSHQASPTPDKTSLRHFLSKCLFGKELTSGVVPGGAGNGQVVSVYFYCSKHSIQVLMSVANVYFIVTLPVSVVLEWCITFPWQA